MCLYGDIINSIPLHFWKKWSKRAPVACGDGSGFPLFFGFHFSKVMRKSGAKGFAV